MPNPDSGNLKSGLGNRPPKFKRPASAGPAPMPMKTASWPALPGKTQPGNRAMGKPRVKIHPKSEGL